MKMLLITAILYVLLYCSNAFEHDCKKSLIEIYGALDYDYDAFNEYISPLYSNYRKKYGYNVVIKKSLKESSSKLIRQGLLGPPEYPPVVFVNTAYKIDINSNEDKIPMFAHGIVILYNIPGINNLNLTATIIAKIYMGEIIYWDDDYIAEYNPSIELPHETIIPVVRMDQEASTLFLTKLLSTNNEEWENQFGVFSSPGFDNDECCNSSTWPTNDNYKFANSVVGMVGFLLSYKYTIGYAVLEALSQYNVSKAGLFKANSSLDLAVEPTAENIRRTMYSYLNDSEHNDYHLNSDNAYGDPQAYPLTVFSSFVINYTYDSTVDCCVVQELVGFIDWFYKTTMDDYLLNQGYVPIIDEISGRISSQVLPKIRCKDGLVFRAFLNSEILPLTQLTSDTLAITVIVCCLTLIFILVLSGYIYYSKVKSDFRQWLVESSRIKVGDEICCSIRGSIDIESMKSLSADHVSKLDDKNNDLRFTMVKAALDNMTVELNILCCKTPIHWSKKTKKEIRKMRSLTSRHITKFFGVSVLGSIPHSIYEYSGVGTLHFVLRTTRYNLTEEILRHLALDVVNGLTFLHSNKITHGFLSSLTCKLDKNWLVKISAWEMLTIYTRENSSKLKEEISFMQQSDVEMSSIIQLLFVDQNILKYCNDKVDIFSLGFLLLEIFTRKLPYADEIQNMETSYSKILIKKFFENLIVQPKMCITVPKDIIEIFSLCTTLDCRKRPCATIVLKKLSKKSVTKESIVDYIMDSVEKHADMLEQKVDERTAELKKITIEMESLLNEMLPPQIASQLLAGHTVQPEQFECVTIYFSDIVGFTSISSRLSPIEVMNFLNDLWLLFDNVIEKYDAYKVDTIGDAYMVCSGLPLRNGADHCQQIALLSLELRELCKNYKIRNLYEEQLKIRIGINSGPVTAGVVGAKMPQYCVFGDTVNTASRMESTSLAQKIQMSDNTYLLLENNFKGQFKTVYRGEIDVKGKGTMKTHWLIKKSETFLKDDG